MDQQPSAPQPPTQTEPVAPAPAPVPVAPEPTAATVETLSADPVNALPNVPDQWPGAWGIYKYSRQAVRLNWQPLLLIAIIYGILGSVPSNLMGQPGHVVGFIISTPVAIALIVACLASIRGHKITLGEAMVAGFKPMTILNYILNYIILVIVTAASLVAFIVPFFFIFPRIVLAPYFLIDKGMGPLDAIGASFKATKGNIGKVWGIFGATIAMILLILTLIGIPFALYFLFMYTAAFVLLYEFITRGKPATTAAAAPEVTTTAAAAAAPPTPVEPPQPVPPSAVPPAPGQDSQQQPPLIQ